MSVINLLTKDVHGFALCHSHADAYLTLSQMTMEGWSDDRFFAYKEAEKRDWLRERI